jgi:hypothetical protein
MGVPIVIAVLCLCGGAFASARWLPDLPTGSIGGFTFFCVCGLVSVAVAVFGLRAYEAIELVHRGNSGQIGREALAGVLSSMLWESGVVFALAAGLFLLASHIARADEQATEAVAVDDPI